MNDLKKKWPHIAFWGCIALIVVNVGICVAAPLMELKITAMFTIGTLSFAALLFYGKAEGEP